MSRVKFLSPSLGEICKQYVPKFSAVGIDISPVVNGPNADGANLRCLTLFDIVKSAHEDALLLAQDLVYDLTENCNQHESRDNRRKVHQLIFEYYRK
jgi:hypothetical protein